MAFRSPIQIELTNIQRYTSRLFLWSLTVVHSITQWKRKYIQDIRKMKWGVINGKHNGFEMSQLKTIPFLI